MAIYRSFALIKQPFLNKNPRNFDSIFLFYGFPNSVISNKNVKEAKELIGQMQGFSFQIMYEILGDELFVQQLKSISSAFHSYNWKDTAKARQLINDGLQESSLGNTSHIREILSQVFDLMPDDEKTRETLQ